MTVVGLQEQVVGDVHRALLVLVGSVALVLVDRLCQCGQPAAGARGGAGEESHSRGFGAGGTGSPPVC